MTQVDRAFCTTREAASLLGVSLSTAQNWAESGLLESWKTEGGHRRITRASIRRLLTEPSAHRAITGQGISHRPAPERLRILVVEDEATLLRIYELRMKTWDISPLVDTASNGFEALVKIGLIRPDLLVTDLNMPHLDGFQMLKSLSSIAACQSMSIVIVSGLDPAEIIETGNLPSHIPILPKPLPFAELERIAKQLAANKSQAPTD
jgi:excisionase family DNA binding protein